jgi:hypothetical protein
MLLSYGRRASSAICASSSIASGDGSLSRCSSGRNSSVWDGHIRLSPHKHIVGGCGGDNAYAGVFLSVLFPPPNFAQISDEMSPKV